MRITLSLQPGSKVALPLELPDEAVPSMTVRELKARIMAMNASKDAAMLHCIHGRSSRTTPSSPRTASKMATSSSTSSPKRRRAALAPARTDSQDAPSHSVNAEAANDESAALERGIDAPLRRRPTQSHPSASSWDQPAAHPHCRPRSIVTPRGRIRNVEASLRRVLRGLHALRKLQRHGEALRRGLRTICWHRAR